MVGIGWVPGDEGWRGAWRLMAFDFITWIGDGEQSGRSKPSN
jgi:hypothetical protein